jgi:hypothetical protein
MTDVLTSPFWLGGEILLGFSLPILAGALIAAFGDQIGTGSHKPSGRVAGPRRLPNTDAFRLPALHPQLGPSRRMVGPGRLLMVGQIDAAGAFPTLTPRLGPARDHAVTSRRAA